MSRKKRKERKERKERKKEGRGQVDVFRKREWYKKGG